MKKLGDELHGPTITTIFQSLDLHGYLDLDQFLTVVEVCNRLKYKNFIYLQKIQAIELSLIEPVHGSSYRQKK